MEDKLDRLATELFRTFARFEYALKAAGFHNGDGRAQANWRSFAETVTELFDDPQEDSVKHAIAYMLEYPPNKQVVKDGALGWDAAVPQTDLQSDRVLLYVRRVRNNLFHGGKFNGRWLAPQRSSELLQHSLTILHACLAASKQVNEAYHSY